MLKTVSSEGKNNTSVEEVAAILTCFSKCTFYFSPFSPLILFCKEKIRFSLPLRASVENLHCRSSWCFLFLFIFEAPSWFNTHMYLKIPTAAVLSFNTELANATQLQ